MWKHDMPDTCACKLPEGRAIEVVMGISKGECKMQAPGKLGKAR